MVHSSVEYLLILWRQIIKRMEKPFAVFWGGGGGTHYVYLSLCCPLAQSARQDILSFLLRWRSNNRVAQKYNDGGMKNLVGKRVQEARQKFKPPLSQEAL